VVGDLGALAVEGEMEVLGFGGGRGGGGRLGHRDSIQRTLVCEVSQAAKREE